VHKSGRGKKSRVKKKIAAVRKAHFTVKPTQRQLNLKDPNTWFYKTTRTINNNYTEKPIRVHELSKGDKWQFARG